MMLFAMLFAHGAAVVFWAFYFVLRIIIGFYQYIVTNFLSVWSTLYAQQ